MLLLLERLQISLNKFSSFLAGILNPAIYSFSVDTSISYSNVYFVYQRFNGTAGDDWGTIDFPKQTKKATVIAEGDMQIRFSYNGTGYEGIIDIETTEPYDIDVSARHAKVKNKTFGESVSFQLIAWYQTSN